MGRTWDAINDQLAAWIGRQQMFFVATAPLAGDGHVNVSPKGMDGLVVTGPTTVSYLDHTGSGVETIAHLRENARITIMLCAFDGPPRIVRLQGRGTVIERGDPRFEVAAAAFPQRHGARAVISVDLDRVSDSCGYGVPRYEFVEQRTRILDWADARSAEELETYHATMNGRSIDGLPAMGATTPVE